MYKKNKKTVDFSKQISENKKRSGPKSSSQTPAKPSERKKGSSKNKPGSAGDKGSKITFSEKVIKALKNKVKEHNEKYSKKVTLSQLKKVYRRGAGAFSQSHRPGKTRGQWAMARVNMFLKMMRGGKVKDSYRAADQDIAKGSYDASLLSDFEFDQSELNLSKIDLIKFNLNEEPECPCEFEEILSQACFYEEESEALLEEGEKDHEVSMSKSQLMKIAFQAEKLVQILNNSEEGDIMAWAQDKISKAEHFIEAVYDYMVYNESYAKYSEEEDSYGSEENIDEVTWAAEEKKGKKLNKPFRTPKGPKKFSVYVKNDKGNVVKVNFGDPNMEIKRDDPKRRKSFRARHNCSDPGPKWKARYWSCKMWEAKKSVTDYTKGAEPTPKDSETHDEYMKRCTDAGYSEKECMISHKGHKFKK